MCYIFLYYKSNNVRKLSVDEMLRTIQDVSGAVVVEKPWPAIFQYLNGSADDKLYQIKQKHQYVIWNGTSATAWWNMEEYVRIYICICIYE